MNFGGMGGGPKSPVKQENTDLKIKEGVSEYENREIKLEDIIDTISTEHSPIINQKNISDVMSASSLSTYKTTDGGTVSYPEHGVAFLRKNFLFVKSFDAGEGVYIELHNGKNYDPRKSFDSYNGLDEHSGMISTLDGHEMPLPVFFKIYDIKSPFERMEKTGARLDDGKLHVTGAQYERMIMNIIGDRCLGINYTEDNNLHLSKKRLSEIPVLTTEEQEKLSEFENRWTEKEN